MIRLWLQAAPAGDGINDLLVRFGAFAPAAALGLLVIKWLLSENKAKDVEIRRLTDAAMEKVLPLVLESTKVLTEANEMLRVSRSSEGRLLPAMDALNVSLTDLTGLVERLLKARPPVKRRAG